MKIVWTVERKDRWPAWVTCLVIGLTLLGFGMLIGAKSGSMESGSDPHDYDWANWAIAAVLCFIVGAGCFIAAIVAAIVSLFQRPDHKKNVPIPLPVPPRKRTLPREWK